MYFELFRQMKKQLGQMDTWLQKATAFAEQKKFDVNTLLQSRLAPDQFPLARQIQIACDTAKLGSSRLTGKEAPSHDDKETTVAQLRERIASTVAYLDTHTAKDFGDAAGKTITNPRWDGKVMEGAHYFVEHTIPNFGFHTSHVYALLRHAGVDIGKSDYLGELTKK